MQGTGTHFQPLRGTTYTIQTTESIDAYMYLLKNDLGTLSIVDEDDDSGVSYNARID
ncbi:hypothetical protein CHISP_2945 [Chitinispirillum alkaliphilum]|nr:hypothetical protein CHISP_2945 [Chitinispirillum alkaliphilum]